MSTLLAPPIAFLVYLLLVSLLSGMGRLLAGQAEPSKEKSSIYSSGEASPIHPGVPGYRPFFVVALFFAVLHLGTLVLGLTSTYWTAVVYLAWLLVALLALILE